MLRVVAVVFAVAVVDHYMLNGQLTGAAFTMSRSVLQYYPDTLDRASPAGGIAFGTFRSALLVRCASHLPGVGLRH